MKFAFAFAGLCAFSCASCDRWIPQENKNQIFEGSATISNRHGGRLSLATHSMPSHFHPLLWNSADLLRDQIYSQCWRYHPIRHEEEPGLCESYERSEDGLEYTFTLREGLRWSDGQPLTAEDFAFTYRVLIDPRLKSANRDNFNQGKDAQGRTLYPSVEVLDEHRVRFKLHTKDVLFHMTAGAIPILPKHALQKFQQEGRFNEAFSSDPAKVQLPASGPFLLQAYEPKKSVLLTRNPNYWAKDEEGLPLPYLDEVRYEAIPDPGEMVRRFLAGELDLIDLRPEYFERVKRREEQDRLVVRDLGPGFTTHYLMFNLDPADLEGRVPLDPVKRKWFQNLQFRRAIAYAIDREQIVRQAFLGKGQPLWSYYTPANRNWFSTNVTRYPYNLERAFELLNSEGFVFKGNALYDADGNRVKFRLMTNGENTTRVEIINLIAQHLNKLGIEVECMPTTTAEISTRLTETRDFDAVVGGWAAGIPPDPIMAKNVMLSDGTAHYWTLGFPEPTTSWESEIDLQMQRCADANEPAQRRWYFDEIQRIFSEQLPQIFLVVPHTLVAARSQVGGFEPSLLPPFLSWNVSRLYLKSKTRRISTAKIKADE